jgi:DNA polymerase V
VKAYRPETNSFSSGQVLSCAYDARKARVVVQEMADGMALSLLGRRMVTSQVVLTVNYDRENLEHPEIRERYTGEVTKDWYGRPVPKHAHGTETLERPSSSPSDIIGAAMTLFDRIVNPDLLIRYLNLTTNHVIDEHHAAEQQVPQQLDLFTDYEALEQQRQADADARDKERRLQEARLHIKERFGKNAILKGLDFEEGATTRDRNKQIGGHKA